MSVARRRIVIVIRLIIFTGWPSTFGTATRNFYSAEFFRLCRYRIGETSTKTAAEGTASVECECDKGYRGRPVPHTTYTVRLKLHSDRRSQG